MKVFIVGQYNTFVNELIKKLHKENDKIYVLTGEKYHGPKPHRVFEQYTFPYTGDSIIEVLDSVKPDVILFTGAYDANFQWQNVRSESMHYMSGLINLILSAQMHQVKHFVYLSSQEVFSKHCDTTIAPSMETSAESYTGIAIAQGEALCRHFQQNSALNISILRIEHLFKMPEDYHELDDPCSVLCAEALTKGSVTINANTSFSMLHVSDAVFGIYEFIHTKQHKEKVYHLASSKEISPLDIANIIKGIDESVVINDNTIGRRQKIILNSDSFYQEFDFKIYHFYEDAISSIYKKMKKQPKKYLPPSERKNPNETPWKKRLKQFIHAVMPFVENVILFLPVFMINNRTAGSQYFEKLDFFLLYVLLFAGIYGTKQAVFSALLSVAGYCFRQLYNRTGIELLIDYNTYLWIAQLFIIAMAVGRLRDGTKIIHREKDEEIRFLSSQLEDLVTINESNNRIKNIYQNRILDYDDSLVKIYSITSELDSLEAGAVLFYAADIIGRILNTDDVAIYQIANSDYCRLFSATSAQAKSLGKSVKYSDMTDLANAIKNKQVYINKTMNADYPLMASAIYRSDEPIEIIMIWGLPFENMTLYQSNLLKVLGFMIYNSVERADRYLDALSTSRFIPDTTLLNADAFEELHNTYENAMEKGFTEYTILSVSKAEPLTHRQWSDILSSKLRLSDYIGVNKAGEVCILLTNSNLTDAQFIIQRFSQMGISCTPLHQ